MILPAWVRNMSLFHDIKLKRRKVDSRCSSDGETSVDINTSSPESGAEPPTRDGESGSGSTTRTSLSEDGGSLGSGADRPPSELDMMCSDPPGSVSNRTDRESESSSPGQNKRRDPSSDCEEDGDQTVESPQHERRNSVFDGGGGERNGILCGDQEGLDLSRNRRGGGEMGFSSVDEEQGLALLRLVTQTPYRPPLFMGKVAGGGPGKTMVWTTSSPPGSDRKHDSSNSPPNHVDSAKLVTTSSTKLSPVAEALVCRPLSPRSQAFAVFTASAGASAVSSPSAFPQYNSHNKSSGHHRITNSYTTRELLPYASGSSRASYGGSGGGSSGGDNVQNFTHFWPSLPTTPDKNQSAVAVVSSSPVHLPDSQALNLTVGPLPRKDEVSASSSVARVGGTEEDDEEQPMVCMICEDKATGLHYGIITCEGCKGFFKRTVQNKRVYTCVADGNCEITKAQRNRCQYCRFQKCLRQGMVLAAVREDRMPGGRNSGAVYNLYKVKYKKHKKGQKNGQIRTEQPKNNTLRYPVQEWANGQILKTALTNPNEILHLRHRLESWVSSSRDRQMAPEQAMTIISQLIECDDFEDVATLKNLHELMDAKAELSDKLCQIGDNIVFKLVQWTKRLPFYTELPVAVHTQLLTHKWHELLVLTTAAYSAIQSGGGGSPNNSTRTAEAELQHEVGVGLCTLHTVLGAMMEGSLTIEQLRLEAGQLVEQLTQLTASFRRLRLCLEEYVCLKVVAMLNQEGYQGQRDIEMIQERYLTALRVFVENRFPQQSSRLTELLARLPDIQSAAEVMLHTKMFYVPFLLNTTLSR